jgi:hypothetical protein
MRLMSRSRKAGTCLLAVLWLWPGLSGAQTPDRQSMLPAVYSTDLVSRNAELTFAAAVLATDGTDEALNAIWLKRRAPGDRTSRAVRIAKLALFDAPVAAFFVGLNHEGGHISRARQKGFPYAFRVVGGPWSSQRYELFALDSGIFDDLGAQAGGFEASRYLKDRTEARYWTKDRISPGHALVSIVSALDLPLYAWWNLAPGQFDDGFPLGDPAAVLSILQTKKLLAGEPYNLDPARSRMRSKALLNFIDTSLWSLVYGLLGDHAWKGEDGVRVRWLRVRGLELLPSVRYELTANAPEYHVRSQFRTARFAGAGYVRWSERVDDARQVGAGGSLALRGTRRVRPRLDLDTWSHTRDGAGLHGAVTMEITPPDMRRAMLTFALGAKSSGHVAALPLDNGAYVSAGLVFTLW